MIPPFPLDKDVEEGLHMGVGGGGGHVEKGEGELIFTSHEVH